MGVGVVYRHLPPTCGGKKHRTGRPTRCLKINIGMNIPIYSNKDALFNPHIWEIVPVFDTTPHIWVSNMPINSIFCVGRDWDAVISGHPARRFHGLTTGLSFRRCSRYAWAVARSTALPYVANQLAISSVARWRSAASHTLRPLQSGHRFSR